MVERTPSFDPDPDLRSLTMMFLSSFELNVVCSGHTKGSQSIRTRSSFPAFSLNPPFLTCHTPCDPSNLNGLAHNRVSPSVPIIGFLVLMLPNPSPSRSTVSHHRNVTAIVSSPPSKLLVASDWVKWLFGGRKLVKNWSRKCIWILWFSIPYRSHGFNWRTSFINLQQSSLENLKIVDIPTFSSCPLSKFKLIHVFVQNSNFFRTSVVSCQQSKGHSIVTGAATCWRCRPFIRWWLSGS